MLSDETYINERIGQRNKAQLTLKNPQIINGGQTAYTLSRILEEAEGPDREAVFQGKEVLLKVITLIDSPSGANAARRLELIDQISTATNQQTPVINADKFSNNADHIQIQRVLFDRYGILYERKRGEFADGLHKGYISLDLLIERNLFFRLYFAVIGNFDSAVRKKLFMKIENPCQTIQDSGILDRLYFSFLCYKRIVGSTGFDPRKSREHRFYMQLYALSRRTPKAIEDYLAAADSAAPLVESNWQCFMKVVVSRRTEFWQTTFKPRTGQKSKSFSRNQWIISGAFAKDVDELFGTEETLAEAAELERTLTNATASGTPETSDAIGSTALPPQSA